MTMDNDTVPDLEDVVLDALLANYPNDPTEAELGEYLEGIGLPKDLVKYSSFFKEASKPIKQQIGTEYVIEDDGDEAPRKRTDVNYLVRKYSESKERSTVMDLGITQFILRHRWMKTAIKEMGSGVFVEVGPFRGRTIQELVRTNDEQLTNSLIVGVDKGLNSVVPDSGYRRSSSGFMEVSPQQLIDADTKHVFNPETIYALKNVYRSADAPNTFIVYGTEFQDILNPGAKVDLVLLRFMLGYLLDGASLLDLHKNILSRSERVFMIDYADRSEFTKVKIPDPKEIAGSLVNMDSSYQQRRYYFTFYAKRHQVSGLSAL